MATVNNTSGAAKNVSEAEKFVSKVAEFLRESVQRNDDWNEDTVKMAFAESVQGLPKKSKAKKKIQDSFELYSELLIQRVFREEECKPLAEMDPELHKLKTEIEDPDNAWFALKQEIPTDWSKLNLEELLIQADYAMKRASFDIPGWVWKECGAEPKSIAAAEAKRVNSTKTCIDCVERCVKYFLSMSFDNNKKSTTSTSSGKSMPLNKDDARGLSEILGKITEITTLRRAAGCVLQCPPDLQSYIARLVFFKYAFRKHMRRLISSVEATNMDEHSVEGKKSKSALKEQRRDRGITAMHDAAVLCRNYRGDIIHFLADSMGAHSGQKIGNNTDANIVFPSSKFLVDLLPNVLEEDDEIFEAALGLGDFDDEWEKQASRVLGLKLISTKNVGINASTGPDLVRRPMLQRWNFERQSFEDVPSNFSKEVEINLSSLRINEDKKVGSSAGDGADDGDDDDDDDSPANDPDMKIDESKYYKEEQLEVPREEQEGYKKRAAAEAGKNRIDVGDENDTASGTIGEVRAYFDYLRVLRRYISVLRGKRTTIGRNEADTLMRCSGNTPAPTLLLAKLPEGMIRAIDPSSASMELAAISEEKFESIFIAWVSAKKFLTTAHLNPEKAANDDLFFFDGNTNVEGAKELREMMEAAPPLSTEATETKKQSMETTETDALEEMDQDLEKEVMAFLDEMKPPDADHDDDEEGEEVEEEEEEDE
ncbi:unnamed protein product [Bathycoccus prasinos]